MCVCAHICYTRCRAHGSWQEVFTQRDPRRVEPLITWIIGLPLELQGDSAFASAYRLLCVLRHLIEFCVQ